MKKNATAWAIASSTMLVFLLLGVFLPRWLHMAGARGIILRIGLIVFGLIVAGFTYLTWPHAPRHGRRNLRSTPLTQRIRRLPLRKRSSRARLAAPTRVWVAFRWCSCSALQGARRHPSSRIPASMPSF
jgi:hypothetical protein